MMALEISTDGPWHTVEKTRISQEKPPKKI